jgi:hypothetical protein
MHDRSCRGWTPARRWLVLALGIALSLAACTKRNPRDCSDGICTDSSFPFCDQDGVIAGNPGACVAVSCMPGAFAACDGDQMLSCNAAGTDYDSKQCEHSCDAAANGCVDCVDSSQCMNPAPTCDASTHACRACQIDDDCASAVCDPTSGTCVDPATIIYVAPDGSAESSCGGQMTPCTFDRGFNQIDAMHNVVKISPGTYTADTAVTVMTSSQQQIDIDGAGATIMVPNLGIKAVLTFQGPGNVRVHGLSIVEVPAFNSVVGIFCGEINGTDVTNLEADQLSFTGGLDAIAVTSCMADIKRSKFAGVSIDISVTGGTATATIDQCILGHAAGAAANSVGIFSDVANAQQATHIHVTNSVFDGLMQDVSITSGTMDIQFSTFVNIADKFDCSQDKFGSVPAQVTYSNDIMYATSGTQTVTGTGCNFHYDLIYPQITQLGDHFVYLDPKLVDVATGDYHLMQSSPAIDAADPAATDTIDLDGTQRPNGPRSDIGAFEYHP